MTHYDKRRERMIETPLGPIRITEKLWNKGEEDEHWAYVHNLTPNFPTDGDSCDIPTGEVVGFFFKQYVLARRLSDEGYELHSQMCDQNLLWVKY